MARLITGDAVVEIATFGLLFMAIMLGLVLMVAIIDAVVRWLIRRIL